MAFARCVRAGSPALRISCRAELAAILDARQRGGAPAFGSGAAGGAQPSWAPTPFRYARRATPRSNAARSFRSWAEAPVASRTMDRNGMKSDIVEETAPSVTSAAPDPA